MQFFGFLASLFMGITLGLMGGGGSILTVPILVYLFALSPMIATGYSLFVVGSTALVGGIMYIRKGTIDLSAVLAFAIPSVFGVNVARGILIPHIPDVVLRLGTLALTKDVLVMAAFAALMVAASLSMIRSSIPKQPLNFAPAIKISRIGLQGFVVGIIAGFVGAGGGFLIIPALVGMAGLSMRVAVGTSLLIIAFQSLMGFAGDVARGAKVNWSLLGSVATFAVMGIVVGSIFAYRIKEQTLKTTFGWFVLVMGIAILFEQLRKFSMG